MSLNLKAKPGGCAECAMGAPFYIPCNKPATCIVYWPSGEECPQCEMCASHSTRNRGAKRKDLPKEVQVGSLDQGAPNNFDHTKRGFTP